MLVLMMLGGGAVAVGEEVVRVEATATGLRRLVLVVLIRRGELPS
jgi:hypothetical protein